METDIQEYLRQEGPTPLETFGDQVGGHFLLLKLGDNVCKPLVPRERFFYESIPGDIRTFTPQYHGLISVTFKRREDGHLTMLAHPPMNRGAAQACPPPLAHTPEQFKELRIQMAHIVKCSAGTTMHKGASGVTFKGNGTNPWTRHCIQNTMQRLEDFGDQLEVIHQDYMVMENLTKKFRKPCILDLKVGTRQYGDDVSDDKRKLHLERCAHSTSHTLGVRICGMQVYNAATDEYTFCDKYFGRDVPEEGFRASLRGFLFNGIKYRMDILPELIKMLEELRDVIQRQNSYRFYSSSLLIMYDGKGGGALPATPLVDRTDLSEHLRPAPAVEENATTHLWGPMEEGVRSNGSMGMDGKGLEEGSDGGRVRGTDKQSFDHSKNSRMNLQTARRFVDVRMIDFAHTTHSGYVNDHIKYSGPDEGYIIGLNTLISIFSELSQDCLTGQDRLFSS